MGADADINPGGFDATVAQDIRQSANIFVNAVKTPDKEVTQIVGKHFDRIHLRRMAQFFHLVTDVGPVDRPPVPGDKNRPALDGLLLDPGCQQLLKFFADQNGPFLAFHGNVCHAGLHRIHRDIGEFGNPDARGAQRLDDVVQPFVFLFPRRQNQPFVLCFRQLFLGFGEELMLDAKEFDFQLPLSHKCEVRVDGRNPAVDSLGFILLPLPCPVVNQGHFCNGSPGQIPAEISYVVHVFCHRRFGFFLFTQPLAKFINCRIIQNTFH
mgnify:CR=1 FL=1